MFELPCDDSDVDPDTVVGASVALAVASVVGDTIGSPLEEAIVVGASVPLDWVGGAKVDGSEDEAEEAASVVKTEGAVVPSAGDPVVVGTEVVVG